ncbi:hypothetical protein RRG08_061578 [Elysia crispata]|uniref:Uncharacterized protein n=1 Tax=Elysia crispata TaxID=231223 RepID=A0AAE0YSQ7_9GAST|nr:hypothetical protein RRG08_061578 [Elysia crispata]
MDFRNKEDMRYSRNQDKTMATQRRNIDQWSVMNNDGQVSFLRPRGGNKGLGFTGAMVMWSDNVRRGSEGSEMDPFEKDEIRS